jgi:hypothetical protein
MQLTISEDFEFPDGTFGDLTVPAKYEVCWRCSGTGEHDCFEGGFSMSDEFVDQDFLEDYHRGVYTITCTVCKGKRVELVPDYDYMNDETRMIVQDWYAEQAAHHREVEAERRAGA